MGGQMMHMIESFLLRGEISFLAERTPASIIHADAGA